MGGGGGSIYFRRTREQKSKTEGNMNKDSFGNREHIIKICKYLKQIRGSGIWMGFIDKRIMAIILYTLEKK